MRALVGLIAITVGCYTSATPAPPPTVPVVTRPERAIAISDPLGFLPDDSSVVVVVDLKELKQSAAWSTLAPRLQQRIPADVSQYFASCGFDPLSVKRVSIGLRDLDGPNRNGVIVIRGYRRDQLMACIEKANAAAPGTMTIENGVVTTPADGSKLVFTFADDTTLVIQIGPEANQASLLASIDSGAPLRVNPRFTEHLTRLESNDPLWFVFDDAKMLGAAAMGMQMRLVMGSARIADGVSAQIRIRFPDPTIAASTATTLQAQTTAAAMFFDELVVSADETDVVVRVVMSDAKLSSAISLIVGSLGP